jgi:soluble lytic murein transglycosylase-like protein
MIGLVQLFSSLLAIAAAPTSTFPSELQSFLGTPPALYTKTLLPEAKLLQRAMQKNADISLKKLADTSEFSDYAEFLLAQSYASKKNFSKSLENFDRLLTEHPHSPLAEPARPLRIDTLFAIGLQASKKGQKKLAQKYLIRALELLPWKEWGEHEDAVEALLDSLDPDSPLYDAYLSEALLALPPDSALRMDLAQDLSTDDMRELTNTAKYRGVPSAAGVKPVNPDSDLFDEAMGQILHKKWDEALIVLLKLETLYPQSDQLDRAHFWHARCLKETGKQNEASKLYSEIWQASPLSYYGLQSAEILGKDPAEIIKSQTPPEMPELEGALLPRQFLGVWKIRALLEVGLVDFARFEANALFAYRPTGAIFGQYNPAGALAVASFFAAAGNYGAGFTEAYAAINLDPSLTSPYALGFLFPNAFAKEMASASELTGINSLLLQSLIKQESAFDPMALSHSDAYGLMQLLPSTARSISEVKLRRDLFQAELNAALGAQYLKKLLERFNGNIALALAAYNAGPTRVVTWQKSLETSELFHDGFVVDAFIDFIPFQETRKYVAAILRNYTWYKLLNKDGSLLPIQELAFQWQKKPPVNQIQSPAKQNP